VIGSTITNIGEGDLHLYKQQHNRHSSNNAKENSLELLKDMARYRCKSINAG